ncbi:MAG: metal transporter [Planctomycetes bacterium]|nr:metal transporter [Planctomycetota bacterium]
MTSPSLPGKVARVLLPLAALGVMVWFILARGASLSPVQAPPIEELTFERVVFRTNPSEIIATVRNTGPLPLTVGQVEISEAIWDYSITPSPTIPRLGRAVVSVAYPWVEGEPHGVTLITSTGFKFSHEVVVALETPEINTTYMLFFTGIGIYVGVIPVFLGLLWFPFLRSLGRTWLDALLAFTMGLLVFLGVDALHEALEIGERVAGVFQPVALVVLGTAGSFLLLVAIDRHFRKSGPASASSEGLVLSYLIATGIGLHNLGEGLAIGAAYTLGEMAMGSFLVLGFTIHNTTEGLAIVAPIARGGAKLKHLALMGLIAGVPTIAGAWIGGFTYSDLWSLLFLAVGAGAVFQVVYALGRILLGKLHETGGLSFPSLAGLAGGFAIMYLTALLVAS